MNRLTTCTLAALILIAGTGFFPQAAQAVDSDCADTKTLEHSFSSGASWSLCIAVDEHHALEVSAVHYRAPGDTSRSVMNGMHVGQILLHYHDETSPRAQLGPINDSRLLSMHERNCDGTLLLDNGDGAKLCSRIIDNRTLAKYAQRPSLQSQRWELSSALQREGLIWVTSIIFEEDGRITPGVTLSGRARELTDSTIHGSELPANGKTLARASILTTWRLVFNLDKDAIDEVQQFDFPLNATADNRRAMQVKKFDTEGFSIVDRAKFRGWRVTDPKGSGYFLEPYNSGFSFLGSGYNWAKFDLAITRYNECERYALDNAMAGEATTACGDSLDDFVNNETLQGTHPVLWFSQSRTLNPGNEDWPVISNFNQSFTLLPYDWTRASPFEQKQ